MSSAWEMPGTEGTGEYVVVLKTDLGRVGYREIGGAYRLRLEPTTTAPDLVSKILTAAAGWKQPDKGQMRYSKVVPVGEFPGVLELAIRTLEQGGGRPEINPFVPKEIREVIDAVRMRRAIFISYRRSDSQREVQRIYEGFTRSFLKTQIFRDIESIPLGLSFPDRLRDALNSTALGLVVIGPQWVSTVQNTSSSRFADSTDFARLEVERMLEMNIPVIPCLVSHARMPVARDLPPSLHPLVTRQGVSLRPDPHFNEDMKQLFEKLRPYAT